MAGDFDQAPEDFEEDREEEERRHYCSECRTTGSHAMNCPYQEDEPDGE